MKKQLPHFIKGSIIKLSLRTLFLFTLFFTSINESIGQFSITGTGSGNTYTQNFDAFTGTLATVPTNWAWSYTDFTPGGFYSRTSAYLNSNSSYALRETGTSTDNAFGAKQDGANYTLTFSATNNTGADVSGFTITWNVEQYSASTNATPINFVYRLNAGAYGTTGVTGTTLTTASTLTTAANLASITSTSRSITITGITLAAGGSADFRFLFGNAVANNAHIGVDDFTMYATAAAIVPTITLNTTTPVFNGAFGNVNVGSSSASSSFKVSGTNLGTNSLAITPPAGGFEIRTGANAFSTNAINLTPVSGTVAETVIDARFTPAAAGAQSGDITASSTGATSKTTAVSGTGIAVVNPTKLVITTINPASPVVNNAFSVTVQAQDGSNNLQNVTANTDVTLSVNTGTGAVGGTFTGTIVAGTNQIVISGVTYNVAETGVVLTATRTTGDALTAGNSAAFNVLGVATQTAFVSFPSTGTVGVSVATFTVEARRADNSVDVNYTGPVTLSIATGTGNITGTNPKSAVAGVATFNDIKFDAAGTFTLNANTGGLPASTSSTITIAPAPIQIIPGELLINQISPDYNGASNEYVELVNITNKTLDLSTLQLKYQSAAGSPGTAGGTLSGTLAPYSYWLLSPDATITVGLTSALPRDGAFTAGFAAGGGQIALVRTIDNVIVDAVGYGTVTTPTTYTETAAAPAAPTDGGVKRITDGVDANNNSTDFAAVTNTAIDLRNSTSRISPAGAVQLAGTYNRLFVTGTSSIGGNVTLTGGLHLLSGILSSTSNTLELAATATVTGGSNTSFVNGPLTRNTAAVGTFLFPIGKGSSYRPVSVLPATTTASIYVGEYFNSTSPSGTYAAAVTGVAQNEYWNVSRTSGSDAQIQLTYDATNTWSNGGPTASDNIAVAHLVGGQWVAENGDVLPGTSSGGTLKTKVLTSFSPFTFGFGPVTILPLDIISFNAVKSNSGNVISWTTANEVNVQSIVLERSADGRNFTQLTTLNAGSSNYLHTDATPINGVNYYRLRIIDKNSSSKLSKVVAVNNNGKGAVITDVYPTITTGKLTIDVTAEGTQKLQFVFTDLNGRNALIRNVTTSNGNNTITLDAAILAKGMYFVKVVQADFTISTFKIIKE